MQTLTQRMVLQISRLGPRFLPFADAATPDLPLSRLLRLALFQVSVGMALVLLVGTLNRVMIVELQVSASLVAVMVALPVLYAPFRALVGFKSDNHRSALGWRRVPFIWMGTLMQFGGLAIMPFTLLVLSGGGNSQQWPAWVGPAGAAMAFLMVGAGMHTTQTAGLALATDLSPVESHPRVVGLMYVMLLLGSIASALIFGVFLSDFSPARLVQVIQACAVTTVALNGLSLWKQETRRPGRLAAAAAGGPGFAQAWREHMASDGVARRLVAIGLGTLAFGMQDVLLEPYGGRVLGMTVGGTTLLTAALAGGGLIGFSLASALLSSSRRIDPALVAVSGAWIGLPAFSAVILASVTQSTSLFAAGVLLIGFGAGTFGHGTLTLTMNQAPKEQAGLALGAWGAVQATVAGVAVALGGIGHDVVRVLAERNTFGASLSGPATGYIAVYCAEIVLLMATIGAMRALVHENQRARVPLKLSAGAK